MASDNDDVLNAINQEPDDVARLLAEPTPAGYMKLEVVPTDFQTRHELFDKNNVYRNFSSPRGLALIINNIEFKGEKETKIRHGTEYDEYNSRQLFTKLGYHVKEAKENLGGQEMLQAAREFVTDKGHASCDSCVVVVLTHGNNNVLGGCDGVNIKGDDFIDCFNAENAPLLKGKPKLLFIQACRGGKHDYGIDFDDSTDVPTNSANCFSDLKIKKLPKYADIFIAYATVSNYGAKRDPLLGSWFVQTVCKIYSRYAAKEDICSLQTKVHKEVAYNYETKKTKEKQMPEFCNRLTHKLYFFPGDDNIFTAYLGPTEVVSKRTMKTEAGVKTDGTVECKTVLIASHVLWGFKGGIQIQAYNKNNEMIWSSEWRIFGVSMHSTSTREWPEKIPSDVLCDVDEIVIVHKHHYEIQEN